MYIALFFKLHEMFNTKDKLFPIFKLNGSAEVLSLKVISLARAVWISLEWGAVSSRELRSFKLHLDIKTFSIEIAWQELRSFKYSHHIPWVNSLASESCFMCLWQFGLFLLFKLFLQFIFIMNANTLLCQSILRHQYINFCCDFELPLFRERSEFSSFQMATKFFTFSSVHLRIFTFYKNHGSSVSWNHATPVPNTCTGLV